MATSPLGQDPLQPEGGNGVFTTKFFMPFLPHVDDVNMDPREASNFTRKSKKAADTNTTDMTPAPMLKVQKRGELQTYQVSLDEIETWDDLLLSLQRLFTFSFSNPPTIMTFEGDMLFPENFEKFMTSGTRLVLAFPIDFKTLKNVASPMSSHSSMASPGSAYSVSYMKKEEFQNVPPLQDAQFTSWQSQNAEALSKMQSYPGPRPMSSSMSPLSSPRSPGQGRKSTDSQRTSIGSPTAISGSPYSAQNRQSIFSSMSPTSSTHEADTPATDPGDNDELNWGFGRDPSLWYPAADKWSTTKGKQELEKLESQPPAEEDNPLRTEIDKVRSRGIVSRMASGFETAPEDKWSRNVRRPSVGGYPARSPGPAPQASNEDLEMSVYPIYGAELEQKIKRITVDLDHDMDDAPEAQEDSTWQMQIDEVEDLFSSHVILCPHITFHVTKPIRLRIHLTPTITVIPPPVPQEHERFYATSVGENLNLEMTLENNGKITSLVSEPENTKYPAKQKEKITLLKKSEGRGAGGKWHIARTDLQLEGSWGNSEVGQLGGMGDDGKRRNNGTMFDLGFKGKDNARRSFALQFDKVAEFIDLFMDTCGFPQRERETMCGFWAERFPKRPKKSHVLLVKILPVKDLITVLPIETDPPPDRVVRFFLVMRAVSRKTIKAEGLEINGVMSAVVREVLGSKSKPVVPATRGRGRGRGGRGRGGGRGGAENGRGGAVSSDGNGITSATRVEDEENGLTIFEYGACLISIKKAAGQWPGLPAPPPADCDAAEFMKKKDEEEALKEAAEEQQQQQRSPPVKQQPSPPVKQRTPETETPAEDMEMGMDVDESPQPTASTAGTTAESEDNYSHRPDILMDSQVSEPLKMEEDYNQGFSTDWHRQPAMPGVELGGPLQPHQQQFYTPGWQPGQYNALGSAIFNPEGFNTGPMGGWFMPTAGY